MKKFVLVAIGGTGMRVAQSLVALAATGFLSDLCETDYKLEIRLVDLDIVPGSDKIELEEMIRAVNDAMGHLSIIVDNDTANKRWRAKGIDATKTLQVPINDRSTLNDLLREGFLREPETLAFHALFSEDDRSLPLRRGCKGRPRIGSLLWAEQFDLDWINSGGFWRSIFGDIGEDDELRVMFAGSVFGGTGASGTPTLAQKFIEACRRGDIGNTAPYMNPSGRIRKLPCDVLCRVLQKEHAVKRIVIRHRWNHRERRRKTQRSNHARCNPPSFIRFHRQPPAFILALWISRTPLGFSSPHSR